MKSVDDPGRAVAVLAAVLTHARRVIGDPARIGLRMLVERRLEQQHPVRRARSPSGPLRPRRARARRRRRRTRRPSRWSWRCAESSFASVVGEVEQVVVAAPAGFERLALIGERRLAPRGESPRRPSCAQAGRSPSSTLARKKPIQTLVPISRRPSTSMPSFQSPARSSGRPFAPRCSRVKPMARRACS